MVPVYALQEFLRCSYTSHLPSMGSDNPSWRVHMDLFGISYGQSHGQWGQMEKPLRNEETQQAEVGRGVG